jgi:hypothetical protein
MNKTNRAAALAFTICLVSSLAFADSPTDAPLMPDDGNTTVVQQQNCQTALRASPTTRKRSFCRLRLNVSPSTLHKIIVKRTRAIPNIRPVSTNEREW